MDIAEVEAKLAQIDADIADIEADEMLSEYRKAKTLTLGSRGKHAATRATPLTGAARREDIHTSVINDALQSSRKEGVHT